MFDLSSSVKNKKPSGFRKGVCPAKAHGQYFDINVAEAQDLGRVAKGEERILTSIPEGYRLEATGLRVTPTSGNLQEELPKVRATIGTNGGSHNPHSVRLRKRHQAEWNGIHLQINDGEEIFVTLQVRHSKHKGWKDACLVTIDPLKAFRVKDQDLVWHPTPAKLQHSNTNVTVWVELSMLRRTTHILKDANPQGGLTKQRMTLSSYKFEPKE